MTLLFLLYHSQISSTLFPHPPRYQLVTSSPFIELFHLREGIFKVHRLPHRRCVHRVNASRHENRNTEKLGLSVWVKTRPGAFYGSLGVDVISGVSSLALFSFFYRALELSKIK